MYRYLSIILFGVIVTSLPSGAAFADAQSGQGFVSVAGSYIDSDTDRAVDDGQAGGQFGIGGALNEFVDLEILLQFADLDGIASQEHRGYGVDLRRVFKRSERFSPYLFLGAGFLEVTPDVGSREDGAMYAVGAGFFADIFGGSDVALRAEYRYRRDESGAFDARDQIVSLGLQIPFGDTEKPLLDGDNDGVIDSLDRCPTTAANLAVDSSGCDLDSDGDGVADTHDRCPNTPTGTRVDAAGCPMDDDGDGVANGADECPNTPAGANVNERGCELDADNDGVPDSADDCPSTPADARVDTNGCELRAEIHLPSVQFESNSDRLLGGTESSLNDAAKTLKRYPELAVEVEGHTDSDGSAEHNQGLSQRRATTVLDYLIDAGVSAPQLSARGYGEARPIANNTTAEGKRQNRRVVLRIISQ